MTTLPLTQSQLGMFLEWNADRASAQYNICIDQRFRAGEVDAALLVKAVKKVLDAYPVFKLRFVEKDGEVVQFVDEGMKAEVEVDSREESKVREGFKRTFDPFKGPMIHAKVVTTAKYIHVLIDCFHLISDGTSFRMFSSAVAAAYAGRELPREEMTFADYALLEPTLFEQDVYQVAKADHAARFAGKAMTIPEVPQGQAPSGEAKGEAVLIKATERVPRAEVEKFCRAHDVHPNLFFMGAFARTLAMYTNTTDAMFQTINHGRRDQRLRGSLGPFVKTVPVLAELRGDRSLEENLKALKLHNVGVYPFTHCCRDLGIKAGFGYVFQDGTVDMTLRLDEICSDSEMFSSVGVGAMPTLQVGGDEHSYELELSEMGGAYPESWCKEFVGRVAEVARQFLTHGDALLREIPTVSAAEAAEIREISRGKNLAYEKKATFVDLFKRQAKKSPAARAIVAANGAYTYGELEAASEAIASALTSEGVKAGDFVAIKMGRVKEFSAAAIGIMKAGAGYVPIDLSYPSDRIAYMVEDCGAKVVVDEAWVEKALKKAQTGGGELNAAKTDLPAYMIYTSGSTGRPKGVVVPHRALVAFCAWVVDEFKLGADSRMGVTASFSFDASVFDLFPSLTVGGEVHILSEELRKDLAGMRAYAEEQRMTGWTMSTQLGLAMLNAFPDVPLKMMVVGGEKILPFAKTAVKVYNGYGPTEFTVASSFEVVDQTSTGEVAIGKAVPNTYSWVCDCFGQILPRGRVGELWLEGVQIADGYWHQPEKTAKAFVNGRYRTGDYAQYDGEGKLLYRGRIDTQVKLRGFRIEIGEIEHAASSFAGIKTVAAEVREVGGTKHLVLYYEENSKQGGEVEVGKLKEHLAATLTAYMVPDYFVKVEAMPLTPVGKIDRKALPEPSLEEEPIVEPTGELEKKILDVVCEVLKTKRIGVMHDLASSGLTSLGAMTLAAKLKKECGLAITLAELAAASTVRGLAALKEKSPKGIVGQTLKAKRPKRKTYPMTENQRGVYADWLKNPATTQYNVPMAFRFSGVDPDTLSTAVARVIEAHPVFKARFVEKDGEIVQERRDDAKLEIVRQTLKAEPDSTFFAKRMRAFSPQGEDLARVEIYAVSGATYLFLDAHHTIFDGFSVGIFLRELLTAIDGGEVEAETATLFDAGLDERDYLESELVAEDDEWFAKYLDGCESTVLESYDQPAQDGAQNAAGRAIAHVPAEALNRRAAELGVSASDWFLTALMELLRRIGRSDDVQILFVSAGRGNADYAQSVGMFVRTLPVRNVKDENTFSATVKRLHADVLALRDHDRASYARIAEKNGLTPEIIFAFEGGLFDLPSGVTLIPPPATAAKFPLSVTVTPGKDDFELCFEYDATRYGAHEMELLVGIFAHLAESAIGVDTLREIPILDDTSAAKAEKMAYGGELEYDATRTFVDLFKTVVLTRSFATAVVDSKGSMTYGELDAASDALAADLAARGVSQGDFVAVKLGRVKEFVVAAIGIMKAGAGYVPIDPDYPADRIAYMVEDCGAKVVIDNAFMEQIKGEGAQMNLATPTLPAYMIYTSGSTGRPKGVVVPHRALRHLIEWTQRDREITYSSHIVQHASFSFDASVIDIFPALAAGAELHLFAEEIRKDLPAMRDYIEKHGITVGTFSTQIGMALVDAYPQLPLKNIMFGGEKLLPIAKTNIKLFNGYGPTEFCVCSSYQIVDQNAQGDIPIGRAVAGTWSFVVDRYGHPLPAGLAGEIALAGPQIADGYWHQPEKTAKAFINGRYHTGDLARYDDEGRLLYLGRMDFQVKLRGFRIEIGEIEHAASSFAGIKTVAAEVRDVGGTKHLVLYYEEKPKESGEGEVIVDKLREHLAATLTAYMVPDYFVKVEAMPMTPNGKINRKALPVPSATAAEHEYVAPSNPTEKTIADAWGALLKVERFGATDDFFQLGGTSLLGIKAVVALQKAGLDVQYGDLFKHKTPRALATFLTNANAEEENQPSLAAAISAGEEIDSLLAKTRTDLFDGFKVHSLGDVLLTGATGYLGIHVLRYLLEHTSSSVTVMLRRKGKTEPARRLDAQYVFYFGERLPKRFHDRISYVEGDITNWGEDSGKLSGIGTVINCAALVKHYIADDALDRVNVKGVENLLKWCAVAHARLVQTSTYSVAGLVDAASPARLDERHLYVGQETSNDYVRTKFLAERAVLASVAAGKVSAKIMRLGNLMGREADGEFQMNIGANAFVNSLKSYKSIGAYPLEELSAPLEMSPIDRVAEAVCLLATTPDDMVVFHPYNCYQLDMGAVLGALRRRGYVVDFTSRAEFAARVDALRADPSRAEELRGILHYAQRHLDGRKATPVTNSWTTTVLYRLGFRWKPADDSYLESFFDMLDGLAAFD